MARTYTLKRRAEQQAETRRRIVEAAVDLHGSVGPAQTTWSMLAERAGVQRHTLYAHFPDERSLHLACSALSLERDPLPVPDAWRRIEDRVERLSAGLTDIYAWYERNAGLAARVLRDSEVHALTRETVTLRFGPFFTACHDILGSDLNRAQIALLGLALGFFTWRSLTADGGLTSRAAARVMARAIGTAAVRG